MRSIYWFSIESLHAQGIGRKTLVLGGLCLTLLSVICAAKSPSASGEPTIPFEDWVRLTTNTYGDLCPDYSPDGGKIAYHAFPSVSGGTSHLWTMNATDGSDKIQLTFAQGAGHPAYSPDGAKIAFVLYHGSGDTDLMLMDSDGANVSVLLEGNYELPKWFPDGSKIVFNSNVASAQIFVIMPNGTGLTQLTSTGVNRCPRVSPDGSKIVFSSYSEGAYGICTMNSDGSYPAKIIENGLHPAYSPDGKMIAFVRRIGDRYDLYVSDAQGKNTVQVTKVGDQDCVNHPTWSPDGREIAFCCYINGNTDIFRIDVSQYLAQLDIHPETLNLRSKGKWITAYIELLAGYDVYDINVSTLLLNGTVHAETFPIGIGDYDDDGIPDLMVKFDRTAVTELIRNSVAMTERFMYVTITVTGCLNDGMPFQGIDAIRIIIPKYEITPD